MKYTDSNNAFNLGLLDELKPLVSWCVSSAGKKNPIQPNGTAAKTNDSSTWCLFSEAHEAVVTGRAETLGIVANGDGFVYIDIDGCRNAETGDITTEAGKKAIELFRCTYIESSFSGTGLRIICKTTDDKIKNIRLCVDNPETPNTHTHREVYGTGQYIRITGNVINAKKPCVCDEILSDFIASLYIDNIATLHQSKAVKQSWVGNEENYKKWCENLIEKNPDRFKKLSRRGNEIKCCSPLRTDRTPSFYMNTKKGVFVDFGGKSGTLSELADLLHVPRPKYNGKNPEERQTDNVDDVNAVWGVATPLDNNNNVLFERFKIDCGILRNVRTYQNYLVIPMYDVGNVEQLKAVVLLDDELKSKIVGNSVNAIWWCGDTSGKHPVAFFGDVPTTALIAQVTKSKYLCVYANDETLKAASGLFLRHNPQRKMLLVVDNDVTQYETAKNHTRRINQYRDPNEDYINNAVVIPAPTTTNNEAVKGNSWINVVKQFGSQAASREFDTVAQTQILINELSSTSHGGSFSVFEDVDSVEFQEYFSRTKSKPNKWIVNNLIPYGLTVLVGREKRGKSWIIFQIAEAVSRGGEAFGFPTQKLPVRYYSLEDTHDRIEDRIKVLTENGLIPHNRNNAEAFRVSCELPSLTVESEGIRRIVHFLIKHHGGLVIIDTWIKAQPNSHGSLNAYERDSKQIGLLKSIADKTESGIVIVTHMNKYNDTINGSVGMSGTPDAILYLLGCKSNKDLRLIMRQGKDYTNDDDIYIQWCNPGFELYEPTEAEKTAMRPEAQQPEELIFTFICEIVESSENSDITVSRAQIKEEFPDIPDSTITRALKNLLSKDLIKKVKHGEYQPMITRKTFQGNNPPNE